MGRTTRQALELMGIAVLRADSPDEVGDTVEAALDSVFGAGERVAVLLGDQAVPMAESPWQLRLRPDPTLLFRFSALTANAHRIHYDTPYCRDTEGYPGLVVHGPLLALLMLESVRRNSPERQVRSLSYRLHRPAFAGEHSWPPAHPPPGRHTCTSPRTGRPGTPRPR